MDIDIIKKDFPIFERNINGKSLVYLDSTATTLKPKQVIDKEIEYYTKYSANIFRGIYAISEEATFEYEAVREKVAKLINAKMADEIVFTRNTTEGINLIAGGIGKSLQNGDGVVTSVMEHHSNFVPWQQRALKKGSVFEVLNIDKNYELDLANLEEVINRKTKVLAVTAVSNVLGTINPIKRITQMVKRLNPECLVIVDAAQVAPHMPVDVQDWGVDAAAFSAHKMCGPTGVGVLWAKAEILEKLPPYQYGGEMIEEVRVEKTLFKKPPHKFEAGTPNIAGVIGLGAAIDYLTKLGMDNVRAHEKEITAYALKKLEEVRGLTIYGPENPEDRGGVVAFTIEGVHAHDIAQILNEDNICLRAGHHCAMPLHLFLNLSATARVSFYIYTMREDVDALIEGLEEVKCVFR